MFMKLNMEPNTRNTGTAGGSPALARYRRPKSDSRFALVCRRAACGPSGRVLNLIQVVLVSAMLVVAQQPARDVSKQPARPVRDWVRDGVIYEIYPRAFSPQGNFNAITARLDELKDLGVTILWLMPIHPIGQEKIGRAHV